MTGRRRRRARAAWLRAEWGGAPSWLLAVAVLALVGAAVLTVRGNPFAPDGPPPSGADVPVAAFIGDAYTAGVDASSETRRWSSRVADAMGWREVNLGRSGTGYSVSSEDASCGGSFCPSFAGVVFEAAAAEADIVVVSGGQSDFAAFRTDRAVVADAVAGFFEAVRRELPEAELVVVGPSTPFGVDDDTLALETVIRDNAVEAGATYVSLLEPDVLADEGRVAEDGVHATDLGHAAIAARVLTVLDPASG